MKNFLTQWELRRKTDPKLEPWGYYFFLAFWVERQVTGPTLTVLRRGCISRLSSPSSISYPGLKIVQPCRVLIRGSRQSNRAESLFGAQGSPTVPNPYLGFKAV